MVTANTFLPERVHDYLQQFSLREPDVLRRLREETARQPGAFMQVMPEVGQLLGFLAELIGARQVLELGTYTGYSALSIALALPPGGRLVALDVNEPAHEIARRYWAEAGVSDRIDLRVGEARDSLEVLLREETPESFDMAFIDADKPGYRDYFEACMRLVRSGGLIAADNVLYQGLVAETPPQGRDPVAMHAYNQKLIGDERVSITMLPIGDGITLARKRPR